MRLSLRLLIFGLLLSHTGFPGSSTAAYAFTPGKSLRVLFIGNSLTQSNDLPFIVQALAAAGGQPALYQKSVLLPGTSLEDQWNNGRALKIAACGKMGCCRAATGAVIVAREPSQFA